MENLKQKIEELISNSEYRKAAELLAKELNVEYKCVFLKNGKHFEDDNTTRDIYTISLTRGSRNYTFEFGQSLNKSGFYAKYGVNKYEIPYEKINENDLKLTMFVKWNLNKDFGNVSTDKIVRPIAPTLYDVMACLTKYDPGTFEDFCSDFGYDTDSRKAEKIYNAVEGEWLKVQSLFNDDELEILREIN